jgi:hypothetical protein
MKKPHSNARNNPVKKVACTVSAAALMLGVSHAATVAMHFQVNYCGYTGYSGFPVTVTAFGVAPSGWQNLTPMNSGYGSGACSFPSGGPYIYSLNETVSTNTSTGGLNPLPSGTVNISWSANTANFSDFGGYQCANNSPAYNIPVSFPNAYVSNGECQVYASFLRDGVNFGPPGGADNSAMPGGYAVDLTGLKSVFTNTPFVVELIASSDSMQALTNAFVIDAVASTTNSVSYPNTPPVLSDAGGASWLRGHGGGLSTPSAPLNTDHVKIMSNQAAHGGTGTPPTGFDNAGTISGFIITDKPVVTMSPNSVACNPGDSVDLSAYAIGVPPLSYQWLKNGSAISGATTTAYSISGINAAKAGNYEIVVNNAYGSATSSIAAVTVDEIILTSSNEFVVDSNPANPERDGVDNGATWLASSSDGTITRTGVMQFVATNSNSITVQGTTNFDSATGTYMFWMRSAGTDINSPGTTGAAALFGRPGSSSANDVIIAQEDGAGNIYFSTPNSANMFASQRTISDNDWHLIVLTFDQSASGGTALYIDGTLDSTNGNISSWSPPVGQPLQFGSNTDTNYRSYNGLLDDIRAYSRELTAAEVATVYSSGSLIDTNALQMQLTFSNAPVPGVVLTWGAPNSVLQSSPTANGVYSDVTAAASPYYVVPKGTQKYYRYRFPNSPQTRISNPYLM